MHLIAAAATQTHWKHFTVLLLLKTPSICICPIGSVTLVKLILSLLSYFYFFLFFRNRCISLNKLQAYFFSAPSHLPLQKHALCCLAQWHRPPHAKPRLRCVGKAKAHEEPIRGPRSQQQLWEASQLSVWTMGTQLNKNILQKWRREGEAGQITRLGCNGIKTQKGWFLKELTCLLFVSDRENASGQCRSCAGNLWVEVKSSSAAAQTRGFNSCFNRYRTLFTCQRNQKKEKRYSFLDWKLPKNHNHPFHLSCNVFFLLSFFFLNQCSQHPESVARETPQSCEIFCCFSHDLFM